MNSDHLHASHPKVVNRLKRAGGHLQTVISMIEADQPCLDVAQQLHAVERAISAAKKALIHDHLDHCFVDVLQGKEAASRAALDEFKDITKYL